MRLPRNLLRSLAITGTVTAALLGGNLPSSSAHVNTLPATTYNGGHGSFNATTAPNQWLCADYSNYSATLDFHHLAVPVTATVQSAAGSVWGEFVDGTYTNTTCPGSRSQHGPLLLGAQGNGGQAISGFTGTLSNTGGTVNCTLTGGTYTRGHFGPYIESPDPGPPWNHPELNIAFQFSTVSGTGCPSTPVILKTTIQHTDTPGDLVNGPYTTSCNASIAPTSCDLSHQEHTTAW